MLVDYWNRQQNKTKFKVAMRGVHAQKIPRRRLCLKIKMSKRKAIRQTKKTMHFNGRAFF